MLPCRPVFIVILCYILLIPAPRDFMHSWRCHVESGFLARHAPGAFSLLESMAAAQNGAGRTWLGIDSPVSTSTAPSQISDVVLPSVFSFFFYTQEQNIALML